MSTDKSEI